MRGDKNDLNFQRKFIFVQVFLTYVNSQQALGN